MGERYTSDKEISECIDTLHEHYGSAYDYHITSEGKEDDFKHITNNAKVPLKYHLGVDEVTTFHHMVMADVLVVAMSTFSLDAAFLNAHVHDLWTIKQTLPSMAAIAPGNLVLDNKLRKC